MKSLIALPYEVLSNIVSNVDFDDILSLGLSCKFFQYLHTEESISQTLVQVRPMVMCLTIQSDILFQLLTKAQTKIRFSNEAKAAMTRGGSHAAALRRAGKRRQALATAQPYIAAIVGLGDAYIYCKGVLCYILDDRVRVLDLHNSGEDETVISIPGLLSQALAEIEDNSRGVFRLLYYADSILSCLYTSSELDSTAWLIAFHKDSKRILVAENLPSTDKIFVRHNNRYLYYGTHSEIGTDGYKKWVICGRDLKRGRRFPHNVHLPDMVGSEIGSTICFEFYREYFYALSNQTSFEVEEIDWTSFYHCIRFPLDCPFAETLEKTENNNMWRRQHQEGPIDDRWTSLRLDEDETSGELKIVESRKEWYLGSSRSQITYYTTEIKFPVRKNDDELALEDFQAASAPSAPISALSSTFDLSSAQTSFSTATDSVASSSTPASTSTALSTAATTSLTPGSPKAHNHDLSTLPDDPIIRLLQADDNPHHIPPPPRLPQNTHPGNDGSHKPTFTLAKSRIRHYHTSASTYLDLVDDPLPTDWQGTQRLRLRAGSRALRPPLTYESDVKRGLLRPPNPDLRTALKEMYRERDIVFWPPAQDPDAPDEDLDQVYRLLNPPSHLGNVQGVADERSLVYVTGGCDKPQAIVFLGFDPAMKLMGLKRWGGLRGGLCQKGVGEGPHIDGRAAGYVDGGEEGEIGNGSGYVDVQEEDRMVTMDRKGKGKAKSVSVVQASGHARVEVELGSEEGTVGGRRSWAWTEKAMYRDIASGFYFGLPRQGEERERRWS